MPMTGALNSTVDRTRAFLSKRAPPSTGNSSSSYKTNIRRGVSFAIETTLRSDITFRQMDQARVQGFELHMLYVALGDFSQNLKRVTDRARAGGHSAPAEQLQKIHRASLANLPRAIHEVDDLNVYDNTAPGGPTELVLSARNGVVTFRQSPCPHWLKGALDQTEYAVVQE